MSESQAASERNVGIEAGSSAFKAVCLDSKGELIVAHRSRVEKDKETFPQLIDFIGDIQKLFGDFDAVGIAVPGLINRESKRIAYSAHIPEHAGIDLLSEIATSTGMKVTMENDANAAAYAEFKMGAGKGSSNLFYVTLGAGVGGAFIFDGKIWSGASGFAGEFGYVAINSEGMKLEDMASAENIVRRTRNRFHQDNTSSLSKLEEEQITLADIIREAQKKDDLAMMMLERTGMFVGTAIASVINLLNIEKIVVGGEIMQAGKLVLSGIISRAKELSFKPSFETTKIVQGALGENAAATGAALLSKVIE
ncbi:MAG TPA: ROK family protein [Nitrosospira sp.]|jgi:glucokinase|nr:ROK family protein [Nitrosospira sp.]